MRFDSATSSQPALSASWLSAMTSALRCASDRCPRRMTGTSRNCRRFAASSRPCPAMIVPVRIDQDRIGPAELADAGGDLVDLTIGVRARIAGKCGQR